MRKDPTIALARLMVRAPIIAGSWTIECDDDKLKEVADMLALQVLPLRYRLLESATQGLIDFGWQPYEIVWGVQDSKFVISKIKPLLQDVTKIVVSDETGDFVGFLQEDSDEEIAVSTFKSLLLNMNVECDYHYGQSYMANAQEAYNAAKTIMKNANIYDKKIAGAHWVIYFPNGSSLYNGQETNNEDIAKNLLSSLENSGSFAIPYQTREILDTLNANAQAWSIDLKEAGGGGNNFEERLQRCDREKVRAFGIPERSILEGQFGTKAEADSHGDFALLGIELLHYNIVQQFNEQIVKRWLRINFGEEYPVYVVNQPLSDSSTKFLQEVYRSLLSNNDGFLNEMSSLDLGALRDRLKVPYTNDNNV